MRLEKCGQVQNSKQLQCISVWTKFYCRRVGNFGLKFNHHFAGRQLTKATILSSTAWQPSLWKDGQPTTSWNRGNFAIFLPNNHLEPRQLCDLPTQQPSGTKATLLSSNLWQPSFYNPTIWNKCNFSVFQHGNHLSGEMANLTIWNQSNFSVFQPGNHHSGDTANPNTWIQGNFSVFLPGNHLSDEMSNPTTWNQCNYSVFHVATWNCYVALGSPRG